MATDFAALPNWPRTVRDDLVTQGSIARALHGITIEQAIRHLAGWGWSHSATQTGYGSNHWDLTAGATASVLARIRLMPFARALEIGILCDGHVVGNVSTMTYNVIMGGETQQITKEVADLSSAYGDYDEDTRALNWDLLTFGSVGGGTATTDAALEITIQCDAASAVTTMRVFGYYIRELFNPILSQ